MSTLANTVSPHRGATGAAEVVLNLAVLGEVSVVTELGTDVVVLVVTVPAGSGVRTPTVGPGTGGGLGAAWESQPRGELEGQGRTRA
jgi:hypothetical protein